VAATAVTGAIILVLACSDSAGPATASLAIEGAGQADTVRTFLATPLTVTVFAPGGGPSQYSPVHFEGLMYDTIASVAGNIDRSAVIARGGGATADDAWDTTDAQGRAAVQVRLGPYVGRGLVRVSVPVLGLTDTARFTILVGNADHVRAQPVDTAVYSGHTAQLRSRVVDRFGNLRPETVAYATDSSAVSVTASGLVQGLALGRATVIASWTSPSGSRSTDTSWISVVPQGVLAVVDGRGLWTVGVDGSNLTFVAPNANIGGLSHASWAPDASSLVFSLSLLYRVIPGALVQRLIVNDAFVSEDAPEFSHTSDWVYFAAEPTAGSRELWRVHADGTGAQRVGPPATPNHYVLNPSPSWDGTRVAYGNETFCCSVTLNVLNLSTGLVDSFPVSASFPRFSPGDSLLAFAGSNGVSIMRSDGSGLRIVSLAGRNYEPELNWSPDGQWIIATSTGPLDLINISTGLTLPLGWSRNAYGSPAWRP
jgi:Tol biopolymer transport system component